MKQREAHRFVGLEGPFCAEVTLFQHTRRSTRSIATNFSFKGYNVKLSFSFFILLHCSCPSSKIFGFISAATLGPSSTKIYPIIDQNHYALILMNPNMMLPLPLTPRDEQCVSVNNGSPALFSANWSAVVVKPHHPVRLPSRPIVRIITVRSFSNYNHVHHSLHAAAVIGASPPQPRKLSSTRSAVCPSSSVDIVLMVPWVHTPALAKMLARRTPVRMTICRRPC